MVWRQVLNHEQILQCPRNPKIFLDTRREPAQERCSLHYRHALVGFDQVKAGLTQRGINAR
jgi:hypothetical protein